MVLTQMVFSVLVALSATFQLTHGIKTSSFCKGRHPKLCHVHIGKRASFAGNRDLSSMLASMDPQSPAARLLADDPATIDLSDFFLNGEEPLPQTAPEFLANQGEDVDILLNEHPTNMRILRLIKNIMDGSLEEP